MRKVAITLVAVAVVFALCGLAAARAGSTVQRISAESVCPVAGCTAERCHAGLPSPEPDGTFQMTCPDTGCASADCHAWDELTGHYNAPSDMSLNLWVLFPTLLAVALVCGVRAAERRRESAEQGQG